MSYPKLRTKRHANLVGAMFAALACLILPGWFGWHTAHAAEANAGNLAAKLVDVDRPLALDAVTVSKVTVAGQQIQAGISGVREEVPGRPFQADEDWLKNMLISLTNRTDKAIVCVQLRLWFPDTGDGTPERPMTSHVITVGQRPESSLYYRDGSKIPSDPAQKPILIAPGQTIVIPVADSVDAIQSTIEATMLFSRVTRVNIQRFRVYFVDGMLWTGNAYFVPDSGHPGKYVQLADDYFPGRPAQNRPPE